MTTFGCATTDSSFVIQSEASSSQSSTSAAPTTKKDRDPGMLRGGCALKRKVAKKAKHSTKREVAAKHDERLEAAAKSAQHRIRQVLVQHHNKDKERPKRRPVMKAGLKHNHVWVGNLRPGYTENDLRKVFGLCGIVSSVSIRCSQGQAVTVGTQIPDAVRRPRDTQYALITFEDCESARKALKFNGRSLGDAPIIVSRVVMHMPECRDIAENLPGISSLDTIKGTDDKLVPKVTAPTPAPASDLAQRPITIEPTVLLKGPPSTNFRLFGLSFQADIC